MGRSCSFESPSSEVNRREMDRNCRHYLLADLKRGRCLSDARNRQRTRPDGDHENRLLKIVTRVKAGRIESIKIGTTERGRSTARRRRSTFPAPTPRMSEFVLRRRYSSTTITSMARFGLRSSAEQPVVLTKRNVREDPDRNDIPPSRRSAGRRDDQGPNERRLLVQSSNLFRESGGFTSRSRTAR